VTSPTVIVPSHTRPERLERLLASLAAQSAGHEAIVVDNASPHGVASEVCGGFPNVESIRCEQNLGYSRAVNLAAGRAGGDAIVLVNDDCVCDPLFVERIVAALDPARGVVMAAGVMRDGSDPSRIDTAGIELDATLLGFDYLNGEPTSLLDGGVDDPVGPSGAAAAFHRSTFLGVGGFDERLFAYWEDVDLAVRLVLGGGSCVLADGARGTHEHSATLGSGSARKNYLMGFGRGYLLRKWGVLTPRRLPAVLLRDGVLCVGQLLLDRNGAGIRGRVNGYRVSDDREPYPAEVVGRSPRPTGVLGDLRRRAARRSRTLRDRRAPTP
jgi:N-acetylglucosaminyl-diphospho-decaprenol L-rhamnosyltransferase